MFFLKASLTIFWKIVTLQYIEPTWSVCRDFSPHCMKTGENNIAAVTAFPKYSF